MAAETLYGDVLIPGIDNLFSHGVTAMFRPVVASPTKFDHGRFLQQEDTVGRMGVMACVAIPFPDGKMSKSALDYLSFRFRIFLGFFLSKLYLCLQRIRMALSTKALRVP